LMKYDRIGLGEVVDEWSDVVYSAPHRCFSLADA
jgi:hypothetical protein